jgi:para-aminobenzoate synthetase/4-amino-4-deoxychorismate lyase
MRLQAARLPNSVLLETADRRMSAGKSYLFPGTEEVLTARTLEQVLPLFSQIDEALARGKYVAGYLSYEAGYAFEPKLWPLLQSEKTGLPLAWFGVYDRPIVFTSDFGKTAEGEPPASPASVALEIDEATYTAQIEAVRNLIAAGDTYQANVTTKARWRNTESPDALFTRLLRAQPVEYSALLNLGDTHILSLSPELFFERDGDIIVTRPMKGTAPRGMDAAEDRAQAAWLAADPKNRSENLMIVDLLRNDLGRICAPGSIQVRDLFHVERFPTLLQMTSTVEGTLRSDVSNAEIFRALFPSGSIVGAPKIRTMEILCEMEESPRGVYTGAIGFFAPDNTSVFNVAIRTVVLQGDEATMGVGSGIVYDSEAASEFAECRTKTAFLTRSVPSFDLIETLLWQDGAYTFLAEHLARMKASAHYFDLTFHEDQVASALHQAARSFGCSDRQRVRLLLSADGTPTVTTTSLGIASEDGVPVLLAEQRTNAADVFLRHKTTQRRLYEEAFAEAQQQHCADALFCNQQEHVTEGAIHNLFAVRNGEWITPPLTDGVLPGLYRAHLLQHQPRAVERSLTLEDLQTAEALYLCNSVRGLRKISRILHILNGKTTALWTAPPYFPPGH